MRKTRILFLSTIVILAFLSACAHAPKALTIAQKTDITAYKVLLALRVAIQNAEPALDTHTYNEAVQAYNDAVEVLKEYDRFVQIAEETGVLPTVQQVQRLVETCLDTIETLERFGVDVSEARELAKEFLNE